MKKKIIFSIANAQLIYNLFAQHLPHATITIQNLPLTLRFAVWKLPSISDNPSPHPNAQHLILSLFILYCLCSFTTSFAFAFVLQLFDVIQKVFDAFQKSFNAVISAIYRVWQLQGDELPKQVMAKR